MLFGDSFAPTTFVVSPASDTYATVEDPNSSLDVTLAEYQFVGLEKPLSAGRQTWKVSNQGTQPHLLELVKVPAGTTVQQMVRDLTMEDGATPTPGQLDPTTIEGVGGIGTLSPGRTGWYINNLTPGIYAAMCFMPDAESGMPHAMLGMIQVFTVS